MNFCSPAFSLNNPSQKSFLEGGWYFSITPFPRNSYGISTNKKIFQEIESEEAISSLTDVFRPFNDQKYESIPIPKFSPHTFLLVLEISARTKSFVEVLCSTLYEYFKTPKSIFFSIILVGSSSLQYPSIQSKNHSFSISTWSDISVAFEEIPENVYFNMSTHNDLFLNYLKEIERLSFETKPCISIGSILSTLRFFIKALKNPVWFVIADLMDSQDKEMSEITNFYFKSSLNCDFYCIGLNRRNSLYKFSNMCNCSVNFYETSQTERLTIDLIYNFIKPRTFFARTDIILSDSLEIEHIYGKGCSADDNLTFTHSILTMNDTIHVFIRPNIKKFESYPPKITFRIRYVDSKMNCFFRYIPIDCSNRKSYPEAIVSAAAVKILKENYDANEAILELMQFDISSISEDELFRKRFYFAVKSLSVINSDFYFASFIFGNNAKEIFQFLSPICLLVGDSCWRPAYEVAFGTGLYVVQIVEHDFVFVTPKNTILENNEAKKIIREIDEKGKFEIIGVDNLMDNQQIVGVNIIAANYQRNF